MSGEMKRLLPVVMLCMAACTQAPVQVVHKGDRFFGNDAQHGAALAQSEGWYRPKVDVRVEPRAEPQPVRPVEVHELPPLQGIAMHPAYPTQPSRYAEAPMVMSQGITSTTPSRNPYSQGYTQDSIRHDLAEIKLSPAVQTQTEGEVMASPLQNAAIAVESSADAVQAYPQNWYQGKIILARSDQGTIASKENRQSHDSASSATDANHSTSAFIWPVRGKVISHYGRKADGLQNDGINIAANMGDPIYASADGVVVYAGNDLQGYGNMLIIRHENGWMTAYAHDEKLFVKENTRVTQGQRIATVGKTGSVTSPQLHFALRNGKTPVDPAEYLRSDFAANP
jgi:murein DD-endopeptidase MepM/ murein hydrolase activator NlpD